VEGIRGEREASFIKAYNQERRILVAFGTQKTCRGIHDAWEVQLDVALCAGASATR
jgi:hypothetical protein